MEAIGQDDLRIILAGNTRSLVFTGKVQPGSSTTQVILLPDPEAGSPPYVPGYWREFVPNSFIGFFAHFLTGPQKNVWRKIVGNDATSITLETAISPYLFLGDDVAILNLGPTKHVSTGPAGWNVTTTESSISFVCREIAYLRNAGSEDAIVNIDADTTQSSAFVIPAGTTVTRIVRSCTTLYAKATTTSCILHVLGLL